MVGAALGLYVLDDAGEPVPELDVLTWARWKATHDMALAFDLIGRAAISTLFLAIDMRPYGPGPPILWETMILGLRGGAKPQWRYTSRQDAEAGHAAAVAEVRDGVYG